MKQCPILIMNKIVTQSWQAKMGPAELRSDWESCKLHLAGDAR